jgi:DNA-binding transcriptional regulator GbsR (MarR family)
MREQFYEQQHFVEDVSLYFEQAGLPRMAGRILGVLLIAEPPQQSLNDLCEVLQSSKGAVSTTTRLLLEMGLIERVPTPLPREVAFQIKTGGWPMYIRMRLRHMASLHEIAERGLGLLRDADPTARQRLQEAHDMFSLIEEELPTLLARIEDRLTRG